MTQRTATVTRLPDNAKERNERQLRAKWAERDRLAKFLREIDRQIVPLQRQVSLDRGYLFTVSREVLSRPEKAK